MSYQTLSDAKYDTENSSGHQHVHELVAMELLSPFRAFRDK